MKINLAVQLYSLRDGVQGDLYSLLKKVKNIGFDGVEFYDFFGIPATEVKKMLCDLDLKSEGAHTAADLFRNDLSRVIEYNLELGTEYLIVPYESYGGKEDYLKMAELCAAAGEKIKAAGMQMLYHNHGHELTDIFDGRRGLDLIYENAPASLLGCQMDVYWITYAGMNAVEYLRQYEGRCPTIHLKDMTDTGTHTFTEVGTGIVDIKGVLSEGLRQNSKWFVVEQDEIRMDLFDSVKISHDNIRRLAVTL